MNLNRIRKATTGAALALVFLFSIGVVTGSTAQAQDRNRRWDRNDRTEQRSQDRDRGDWSRRQQIERARAIERARQLAWERERLRSRNVYPRTYPNGGYYGGGYGNNGSYGNYGRSGNYGGYGGGSNGEVQRGFSDGLDRGQEDLRAGRSLTPNNSSHYRSGNAAYREGFRRGYEQAVRQLGGGRRW